jgi:hypothetical protein
MGKMALGSNIYSRGDGGGVASKARQPVALAGDLMVVCMGTS